MTRKSINVMLGLAVALLLAGTTGLRAEVLYGAFGANATTSDLVILNPANGAQVSTVGPIGYAVTGLAVNPLDGTLYGATSNNSGASARSLIRINKQTGAGTLVGGFGTPPDDECDSGLSDLTFTANGILWGWNESCDDNLYSVNLATGAATRAGISGLDTYGSGIAFSPGGVMFLAGNGANGELRTVGAGGVTQVHATLSSNLLPDDAAIAALAFNAAGVLYGVWIDNNRDGPRTTHLLAINTTTGVTTDLGQSVNKLDAIVFDGGETPFVPTIVPTLSQWALVLLMALLAGTAVVLKRRRS